MGNTLRSSALAFLVLSLLEAQHVYARAPFQPREGIGSATPTVWGMGAGMAVAGDRVLVGTQWDGSCGAATLLDARTGGVVWSTVSPDDPCSGLGAPAVDDFGYAVGLSERHAVVAAARARSVYVYDAEGMLLRTIAGVGALSSAFGRALAVDEEVVAIADEEGMAHVYDVVSGVRRWSAVVAGVPAGGGEAAAPALALAAGMLFVAAAERATVHAFDVRSGTQLWAQSLRFDGGVDDTMSPTATLVGGGVAIAADARDVVATAPAGSRWAAFRLDARTGRLRARYRGRAGTGGYQSVALSRSLVAVGFTNVGTHDLPARVYVYGRRSGRRIQTLRDDFGNAFAASVALIGGRTLLIGVPERDLVRIYERRAGDRRE